MNNEIKQPSCAKWKLWVGREIEGRIQLGVKTLFVRDASMSEIEKAIEKYQLRRVWFCFEFMQPGKMYTIFRLCSRHAKISFVAEMKYETMSTLAHYSLREHLQVYLKLPELDLRPGDHICVGPAFSDEALLIGTGHKVKPELYEEDIRIK